MLTHIGALRLEQERLEPLLSAHANMGRETTPLYPIWTEHLPLHHFMLQDVLGSLTAVLAFAAVLFAPGFLLAEASDLFGFRRLRVVDRFAWAIACSFLIAPIAAHLVGRTAGLAGVCWLFALFGALALWRLLRNADVRNWPTSQGRIAALVVACWTALVLLLLVDFQVGHKLYFSVVMADQSYRIAFTDAVVRTGIPPANPLYFAGTPAPMRYYYFWYVLCAAIVKLSHVSARQAFIASSVWAGFGLLATVRLYTRHFFRWPHRKRWVAYALLLVSGADLLPALGQVILQPSLNGDTEWWSVDPIDSWPDSLLWVPHHVASVLCCLLAFLLLWRTLELASSKTRRWAVVLAALAFASAVGLSVYVAFGFVLMMAAWLVWLFLTRNTVRVTLTQRTLAAGVLSAFTLAPFLLELTTSLNHPQFATAKPASPAAPTAQVFSLSVRRMIDSGLLTGLPALQPWNLQHPLLLDQGIRLLLLVPGLAMELGLYGAVLVLLLKNRRALGDGQDAEARRTALFFVVAGLVFTLFLSSSVITNNDFGYRAVMLPQFFLLLLTADVLGSWWTADPAPVLAPTPGRRRLLYALLAVGVAGMAYWAVLLRAWLPIVAAHPQSGYARSPGDEFYLREAFRQLNRLAPANAVVAFRPIDPTPDRQEQVMVPNEYYQRMLVMDTGRQMLNAEGKCAVHFGGDPSPCADIQQAIAALYAIPAPDAAAARAYCRRFGVHFLVLSSWDPDWTATAGWPVTLPVLVQQPGIRIVNCL